MYTLFDFITVTKSVEYLIAIGFLAFFVFFWRYVNSVPAAQPVTANLGERLVAGLSEMVGGFLVPESVHFHPGHAWAKADNGNVVTLGIDDFGQKLVGAIEEIRMPGLGETVTQGERAWTMGSAGKKIDMLAPVDGEVIAVNNEVLLDPQRINRDPFGDGWLLKVRAPRKEANLKGLLTGELAKKWVEEARNRLLGETTANLGAVLADAGPARQGLARIVDEENWDQIVREAFLTAEE